MVKRRGETDIKCVRNTYIQNTHPMFVMPEIIVYPTKQILN